MSRAPEIEEIYPLSPMQEGMLFHALLAPGSEEYFEQLEVRLEGVLDPTAFRRAFEDISAAHPILRTGFNWEKRKEPFQIVYRRVGLPWFEHDWRSEPAEGREDRLQACLRDDRRKGFDLAEAPAMRLHLFRLGETTWHFCWSHHHLLLDGWSRSLLVQEWLQRYRAATTGGRIQSAPPRPFRAYIAWLGRQDAQAAERFWREELKGFETPPALALGRPTQPQAADPGVGETELFLTSEDSAALRGFAGSRQLTLATVALGAWSLLIGRLGGTRDPVCGVTVSGRPADLEGVESMVGLFINTLPVRVRLDPSARVATWLGSIQGRVARLRQFEFTPLARIRGWAGAPAGDAMFESILVFENYPVDPSAAGAGLPFRIDRMSAFERTNYPLTMIVSPGERLGLRLLFDRRRFDDAQARRLASYFGILLGQIAGNPESAVGELEFLPPSEQSLLREWNQTGRAGSGAGMLHHLFERRARQTPEATALVTARDRLSYRELDFRADRLAETLRRRGAGPERLVGLCLERTADLVIGMIAILKAGSAYVPLDPKYPRERLRHMLADSRAGLILSQASLRPVLPPGPAEIVCVDEADLEGAGPAAAPGGHSENLAYVIYTSGSTGVPKGTAITHGSAVAFVDWALEVFSAEELAGVLFSTSVCFDLSVFEVFVTLAGGGSVVLAENALALETHPALGEITLVNTVPSAIAELLRLRAVPDSVRTVNLAGEPLSAVLADRIYAETRATKVYDLYGPSEDTTYSTFALRARGASATIGRPIANTRLYLLDRHFQPVPVGVIGELCLAGLGLARGYHGRPDLTAERFVPEPFDGPGGGRLYRTGDLARFASDGSVEFIGRSDQQIKIRGFRVELGEIRARLESRRDVAEAVVTAADGGKIVAYAVMKLGAEFDEAQIRADLARALPEHMMPSEFVLLEAIPRTPNGKVDRKALRAPGAPAVARPEGSAEWRTPTEEVLAGLWADVLGRPASGRSENFFEAGGHSLLATQLVSRMREVFRVGIALRTIFEAPVLADLAAAVDAALRERSGLEFPEMRRSSVSEETALSFAQRRLWFLDQLQPNQTAYNVMAAWNLEGRLDPGALERSLSEIVRRHESLRTVFSTNDGRPRARVLPAVPMTVTLDDCAGATGSGREEAAARIAREEAGRPFDLASGPLIRARIARFSDASHALFLTLHHIATDGWSMEVLMRELTAHYEAFEAGRPSPLPPLQHQYGDYARWQHSWLEGAQLEREVEFWRNRLAGVPPVLELPADGIRLPVPSFQGAALAFRIPPDTGRRLLEIGRQEGATAFMVFLAAFQVLLARITGQRDLAVGTPIANRHRPEVEPLIGFFSNTLVLRSHGHGRPTFRRWLRRLRTDAIAAFEHQDLPFDVLVERLGIERDLSRNPLFQTVFSFQGRPARGRRAGGLTLTPRVAEPQTTRFDLECHIEDGDAEGGLSGLLVYRTDLFGAQRMRRTSQQFLALLDAAGRQPDSAVGELPLAPPGETDRVVRDWNATAADFPRSSTLPEIFARQVGSTPDAVALRFGGTSLTYSALDRRTNRLARWLRGRGVGREEPVALCFERSMAMAEAQVAVLKAGGAYVPLEPATPRERAESLLAISRARWVLAGPGQAAQFDGAPSRVLAWPDEAALAQIVDSPLDIVNGPEDLAYVMFTSGSTGAPKGVGIPHRAILRLVCNSGFARFGPGEVLLQLAPYSFDASTLEFWGALLAGGRLAIYPAHAPTVEGIGDFIRSEGVTTLWLTAGLFHAVVEHAPEAFRGVRQLLAGGDVLRPESCRRALEANPGLTLINGYGPTESTTFACCESMTDPSKVGSPVPIGRPIANTRVYVLDPELNPCPLGVPGELHVGGDGLARGYAGRPDLTAEKFVPDPFSRERGARLYRTGDRVRHGEDGRIEFIGRMDFQVKIRGFRVEPGEIEVALASLAAVREAVVVPRREGSGANRLVAYVVPTAGRLDTESILRLLREKLPEHLVPAAIVTLERLPLGANGKVDRRALPEASGGSGSESGAGDEAIGEAERILARTWREVLRVPAVGRNDNFFSLGGDSILSIQIVARAGAAGWALTPAQMFQHQTVAELARVARPVCARDSEDAAVVGPAPFSPAQRWWLEEDPQDWHHFNQAVLLRVARPLDRLSVSRLLEALDSHHDALRGRVCRTDAGWEYSIDAPGRAVPLRWIDPAGGSQEPARIAEICAEEQARLAPADAVLWRAAYFEGGPGSGGRLFIVVHHLAVDGVSWRILHGDLERAAAQIDRGEAVSLPAKTTSFKAWCEHLESRARRGLDAGEREFWAHASKPSVPLPRDYLSEASMNLEGGCAAVRVILDAVTTEALARELPALAGIPLEAALLAGAAQAVALWTGRREISFTMEGHGREDLFGGVDLSRTVGWFTAIYPLRISVPEGESALGAAARTAEQLRRVPHRGIGYGLARYLSSSGFGAPAWAEPELSFNYLGRFDSVDGEGTRFLPSDEDRGPDASPRARRRHLIEINGNISGGQLRFEWRYGEAVHRRATIERMAQAFADWLRGLAGSLGGGGAGVAPSTEIDEAIGEVRFN